MGNGIDRAVRLALSVKEKGLKLHNKTLSEFSSGVNPRKIKVLKDYLLPGSCLDIGCGNGLYGQVILESCSDILQIDIIDRRAPQAKRYPFRALDANKLDLPSKSFNNVVAFDIMEHIDDDTAFLKQVRKICQGRLILSVPNEEDEQPRMIGLTHMHHIDKTHKREYTKESLQYALEKNGLKVINLFPQYNRGLFYVPFALAKGNYISKVVAKTVFLQNLFYEKVGLFENRCIGDWFCVAEVC